MITLDSLEKIFSEIYKNRLRESIISDLRARGVLAPYLEAIVDRYIADSARSIAPEILKRIREELRRSHANSAEGILMLLGRGDPPVEESRADWIARLSKQKMQHIVWLDRKVSDDLKLLSIEVDPTRISFYPGRQLPEKLARMVIEN